MKYKQRMLQKLLSNKVGLEALKSNKEPSKVARSSLLCECLLTYSINPYLNALSILLALPLVHCFREGF